MTPKFRLYMIFGVNHTTKNVGIHLLPVRYLRPSETLQVDEQSDTHEYIADTPTMCALKAWLAFTHTAGYTFSIPVASNSAVSLTCI